MKNKMKTLQSVAAASLVVLLALSAAGCGKATNTKQGAGRAGAGTRQMAVETQTVKLTDVGGGQMFTGSIAPAFTTNLSSRVSGRIASIDVKVGDRVKAGQALAHIDTTQLEQQLEQSKGSAAVTQAQYDKAASDQANNAAAAEKTLAAQQAAYDKAVNDANNSIASAKQAVALAQAQLNNAITSQQNSVSTAKQNVATAQTSFNSVQTSAANAITVAQNNLNAQLDSLLTSQANNLQNLQLNVQSAAAAYNAAVQSKSGVDAALTKLQQAQLALQQAQQTQYKDAQSAQQAAQSQLTSLQNALLQAQSSTSVQTAQESLNAALVSLANAQATAASQIDVSQQQLSQAQISYANAQNSSQISLSSAKANWEQAQMNYKNSQSTESLKVNAAQLAQAQTNVKVLEEQLEDGVLKAPVDGVVTAVNTPVGQNANGNTGIMTLASLEPVLATVNVSEATIGKIKLGEEMIVKVSTLNKTFDGHVYAIHPTMDATSKSYVVDIELSDPQHELLPGMFAESSLKSEGRQAIMVPADAVVSQPSGNAVYIVKDGKAKKVLVKLGAITSTAFEVTEGLQVGDELVVKGMELLSDNVPVVVGQPAGQGQGGQQGQSGQGQRPNGQTGQNGQNGQRPGGAQGQGQGQGGQRPNGQNGQSQGQGQGANRQNGQSGQSQTGARPGGQPGQSAGGASGGADSGAAKAGAGQ